MRLAMDGKQAQIWTALPCIIQSFNPGAMTCEAQPTVNGIVRQQDGTSKEIKMPLLLDCPVFFPGGGGVTLTFPIKPGDEVGEVFIDRLVYYNKPCKLPIVGAEHMRHFVERPSTNYSRAEGCAALTATGKIKTLVIRGEFEEWQVWPKSVFFRGKVNAEGSAEYIEPLR